MGFYESLNGVGVVHLRLVDDGSFVGDGVDGDRGVDALFIDGWKKRERMSLSMVIGDKEKRNFRLLSFSIDRPWT